MKLRSGGNVSATIRINQRVLLARLHLVKIVSVCVPSVNLIAVELHTLTQFVLLQTRQQNYSVFSAASRTAQCTHAHRYYTYAVIKSSISPFILSQSTFNLSRGSHFTTAAVTNPGSSTHFKFPAVLLQLIKETFLGSTRQFFLETEI